MRLATRTLLVLLMQNTKASTTLRGDGAYGCDDGGDERVVDRVLLEQDAVKRSQRMQLGGVPDVAHHNNGRHRRRFILDHA